MSTLSLLLLIPLLASLAAPASSTLSAAGLPPQARGGTAAAQRAADVAKVLAGARESLAAGRADEAITQVDGVLGRDPANRDAARIKTEALVGLQEFDKALAAYDASTTARRQPDADTLAVIGRGELRRMALATQDSRLVSDALERLARQGDAEALRALKRDASNVTSVEPDALAPVLALVRLGDKAATEKLGALFDSAPPDVKGQMIQVLQESGARSLAPKLLPLLDDAQPQIRSSAALALGVLQFAGALPRLQAVFESDLPIVRMFAAAALKRLGQSSADAYLAGLMRSEIGEVRLVAAEAYQSSKSTQWLPPVRALLTDRNEMTRLRAADLIACCDETAARAALLAALDHENPLMRNEAARVLEARGLATAQVARRLLGDPSQAVRLHGAGAAVGGVVPPKPGRLPVSRDR